MYQGRDGGEMITAMLEAAFPYHEDAPSLLYQPLVCFLVAANIRLELGFPERRPSARCRGVEAASVPMPEAAVHKDGQAMTWQDKIRRSR